MYMPYVLVTEFRSFYSDLCNFPYNPSAPLSTLILYLCPVSSYAFQVDNRLLTHILHINRFILRREFHLAYAYFSENYIGFDEAYELVCYV